MAGAGSFFYILLRYIMIVGEQAGDNDNKSKGNDAPEKAHNTALLICFEPVEGRT